MKQALMESITPACRHVARSRWKPNIVISALGEFRQRHGAGTSL